MQPTGGWNGGEEEITLNICNVLKGEQESGVFLTLVSVTMQSKGQEKIAILASLTDVTSPSASFLNTMPWCMVEEDNPQPCMQTQG